MSDADDATITHLPSTPSPWAVALGFAVIYLAWGTTYFATGIAMRQEHMPPALFGGARFITAGTILLLLQFARGQELRLKRQDYLRLFVISSFLFLSANL